MKDYKIGDHVIVAGNKVGNVIDVDYDEFSHYNLCLVEYDNRERIWVRQMDCYEVKTK